MGNPRVLGLAALLCFGACIVTLADDDAHGTPPQTPPTTDQHPHAAQPVSLEGAMKGMNRAFKVLRGQIADPTKNASSLALLGDFERNLVIAKGLIPEKLETLDADAKAKALADYRTMMLNLLRQTLDIEDDLLAGKNADAAGILGKFKDIEKEGHKEFRGEEH